jgi:hypothetical protein
MAEDDLIFLTAAILLANIVGARPEPADERQIDTAVSNAHSLYDAIQKRREQIRTNEPFGHS